METRGWGSVCGGEGTVRKVSNQNPQLLFYKSFAIIIWEVFLKKTPISQRGSKALKMHYLISFFFPLLLCFVCSYKYCRFFVIFLPKLFVLFIHFNVLRQFFQYHNGKKKTNNKKKRKEKKSFTAYFAKKKYQMSSLPLACTDFAELKREKKTTKSFFVCFCLFFFLVCLFVLRGDFVKYPYK